MQKSATIQKKELPQSTSPPGKVHSYRDYENSTYTIVSKVAYLIGIPKRIFENVHEPPQWDWYQTLEEDQSARVIRNLCILRTALMQNYKSIHTAMKYDLKNLHTLPKLVPSDSLSQLEQDGVPILKANCPLDEYILDLNHLIANRINSCKDLFPLWLSWEYIHNLFIMPNGTTEQGIRVCRHEYYHRRSYYPYQMYLNWNSTRNDGNILYTDKKFVSLLYEINGGTFHDLSKVTDAGNLTKEGIYHFLEQSDRTAVVVDCENADPYKLYATLHNLDQKTLLNKIVKIILYNDSHAATAWMILNQFTEIPIEHVMVERVKDSKSLVDIRLTTGACREFFQNHIDSFILVSSDSDYWGLITSIPEARFLVLVENEKCGADIKKAMSERGIPYCFVDDFCTGNSDNIKTQAVLGEIRRSLDAMVQFNINAVLDNAFNATRANMTEAERNQFFDKYIKPMRLVIAPDGIVRIELGPY